MWFLLIIRCNFEDEQLQPQMKITSFESHQGKKSNRSGWCPWCWVDSQQDPMRLGLEQPAELFCWSIPTFGSSTPSQWLKKWTFSAGVLLRGKNCLRREADGGAPWSFVSGYAERWWNRSFMKQWNGLRQLPQQWHTALKHFIQSDEGHLLAVC